MSKQAFTPGPWTVHPHKATEVLGADGHHVADTFGPHLRVDYDGDAGHWANTPGAHREQESDEEEANARLIAASPALLEACEEITETLTRQSWTGPEIRHLREAIALARESK